jgi:hypothetical protein
MPQGGKQGASSSGQRCPLAVGLQSKGNFSSPSLFYGLGLPAVPWLDPSWPRCMKNTRFYLLNALRLAAVVCGLANGVARANGASWSHSEPRLNINFAEALGGNSSGGFLVLSLELQNASSSEVPVDLNVTFEGRFRSDGGSVWTQIAVPPGKGRRQVFFPSPYADGLGANARVESVGPNGRSLNHLFSKRVGNDGTAPFAVAGAEYGHVGSDLAKVFNVGGSGVTHYPALLAQRFAGKVPLVTRVSAGKVLDFGGLPQEARGLSCLTALWLNASDWNNASPSLRWAVRDWVRAGGRLFVMSKERPALADLPEKLGALGLGRVALDEPLDGSGLKRFSTKVLGLDDSPFPGRVEDYAEWKSSLLPPFEAHVRLLLGLLLGFLVLLLPVNFLWLAPVQKRHRLFVTVPVISLLAGTGLLVVVLLTDGTGGIGIRNGLFLVGEGSEGAVLYQEQLSRTGMVSSTRFALPEDTAFVMCKMDRHDGFRSSRFGEETAGDWFSSRSIQGQALQRWLPAGTGSAAVNLQAGSGEAPVLVAKGFSLRGPVFYADKNGDYWTSPRLSAGTPAVMVRASARDFEDWFGRCISEPSSNLKARMREALQRRDWFFGAAGEEAEHWVPTLPQVRWVRNEMLCLGPVQREEAR